mgnify:CR=1 FL=1
MPSAKRKTKKSFGGPDETDSLEKLLQKYLDGFTAHNPAARVIANDLRVIGIGLRPVVDHLAFCTLDIHKRVKEFLPYGYRAKGASAFLRYDSWRAKIYRKPGYPALLFFEPPARAQKGNAVKDWIGTFGDENPHHIAVKVDNIENGIFYLEKQGVAFVGGIEGDKNTKLRQVFTAPEIKSGKAFSALELTERHAGYEGFIPQQEHGLIKAECSCVH